MGILLIVVYLAASPVALLGWAPIPEGRKAGGTNAGQGLDATTIKGPLLLNLLHFTAGEPDVGAAVQGHAVR